MSSVSEIEKRMNEIIFFLEQLELDRTDIDVAIFNMRSSLRKMLAEYSKDYPDDTTLEAYKRAAEKDGIYGEYIASMYDNRLREKYIKRMQINNLAGQFRNLVISSTISKTDEKFIMLLADYRFLLILKEKAMLLLFELTEKEEEKLASCEDFITQAIAS